MNSARLTMLMMVAGLHARALSAQCANGAPPPCAVQPSAGVTRIAPTLRPGASGPPKLTGAWDAVPLSVVARELSSVSQRTIVVSSALESARITADINYLPWDEALATLLGGVQATAVEDTPSGVITIRTKAELRGRPMSAVSDTGVTARELKKALSLYEQFNLEATRPILARIVSPEYDKPVSTEQRVSALLYLGASWAVLAKPDSAVKLMLEAADLDPFVEMDARRFSRSELTPFYEARSRILRVALRPMKATTIVPKPDSALWTFESSVTQRARITVTIVSVADSTKRVSLFSDVVPAGRHLHQWRGTLGARPAPAGVYEVRVSAKSSVTDRPDVGRQFFRVGYGHVASGALRVMLTPVILEP